MKRGTRMLLFIAASRFDRSACERYWMLARGKRYTKDVDWPCVRQAFANKFGLAWVRKMDRRKV
jgi:hypothetical protein